MTTYILQYRGELTNWVNFVDAALNTVEFVTFQGAVAVATELSDNSNFPNISPAGNYNWQVKDSHGRIIVTF